MTSASGSFSTTRARRGRWRVALAGIAAALGLALLALNLYGLTRSLRAPEAATGTMPGQMFEPPISPEAAFQRLQSLPTGDRRAFALQAAETIGQSMAHLSFKKVRQAGGDYARYHYTIPAWENYLLFALRYLKPDTYLHYEMCSWRRAVERGIGQCGQKSMAVTSFLAEHGYRTAFIHLPLHVMATAEVAPGEWYVLDADFRAYFKHDIEWLRANPEALRQGYAHSAQMTNLLDRVFHTRAPEIVPGDAFVRYPRACRIETAAYVAKWALPAALLVGAMGLFVWHRRRISRA